MTCTVVYKNGTKETYAGLKHVEHTGNTLFLEYHAETHKSFLCISIGMIKTFTVDE